MTQGKRQAIKEALASLAEGSVWASAEKQVKALRGYRLVGCGKSVPNSQAVLSRNEGGVFHVQRMLKSLGGVEWGRSSLQEVVYLSDIRSQWRLIALVTTALAVSQGFSVSAQTQDKPCVDFYAVGESKCDPAPKPVQPVAGAPVLLAPSREMTEDQKVDEFLENYGKPPREFVQFYMNPTPDNAKKWVETYQDMMKKSQNLSDMWSDAERLYGQPQTGVGVRRGGEAVPSAPAQMGPAAAASVPPSAQASPLGNFGGFTGSSMPAKTGGVMPQDEGLKITYYYSQVCPYCARMTPELAMLTTGYAGKLEFTCVDVTPFSPTVSPNPAFLRDKLACQWRLPQADELQQMGVVQTPTLFIQQGVKAPVKLSGYMSQEQLKPYLAK